VRRFPVFIAVLAACSNPTDAEVDIDVPGDSDAVVETDTPDSDPPADSDAPVDTDAVVDSDVEPADDVAISDVQSGAIAAGTHVFLKDVVVTGMAADGIFVSEPAAALNSGLWVYLGPGWTTTLARADRVDVSGVVAEYGTPGTITQLSSATVIRRGAWVEPAPLVVDVAVLADPATAEPYEGVLVRIENVTIQNPNAGYGEWTVSGGFRIGDLMHEFGYRYAGDTFDAITGVVDFRFGTFKLEPRAASDFVGYSTAVRKVPDLVAGDLVITEIMADPQDAACSPESQGEYIEIFNPGSTPIDLFGLQIKDTSAIVTTVEKHVVIAAGAYALGVAEPATSFCYSGFSSDFEFDMGWNNTGDKATLTNAAGVLIDVVDYQGWTMSPGKALSLGSAVPTAAGNDAPSAWCPATSAIVGSADFGTPRAANPECPPLL
jgi:hypothetical protein